MRIQPQPLHEITKQAIEVLYQQIGLVNTVRFINQFTIGYGNYTEEREQLFASMTLDDVIAEIEEMRDKGTFSSQDI